MCADVRGFGHQNRLGAQCATLSKATKFHIPSNPTRPELRLTNSFATVTLPPEIRIAFGEDSHFDPVAVALSGGSGSNLRARRRNAGVGHRPFPLRRFQVA